MAPRRPASIRRARGRSRGGSRGARVANGRGAANSRAADSGGTNVNAGQAGGSAGGSGSGGSANGVCGVTGPLGVRAVVSSSLGAAGIADGTEASQPSSSSRLESDTPPSASSLDSDQQAFYARLGHGVLHERWAEQDLAAAASSAAFGVVAAPENDGQVQGDSEPSLTKPKSELAFAFDSRSAFAAAPRPLRLVLVSRARRGGFDRIATRSVTAAAQAAAASFASVTSATSTSASGPSCQAPAPCRLQSYSIQLPEQHQQQQEHQQHPPPCDSSINNAEMSSRSRPRNGAPPKEHDADAQEELTMWEQIKKDLQRLSQIQKKQQETSRLIIACEEKIKDAETSTCCGLLFFPLRVSTSFVPRCC